MKKYTVGLGDMKEEIIESENASQAINIYSVQAGADQDVYFLRGGWILDAETRGEKWASVRSDAGRISAELLAE